MVKAAFEIAEGLADAASLNFAGMAGHFAAAGKYALVGSLVGIAAGAMSKPSKPVTTSSTLASPSQSTEKEKAVTQKQTINIYGDVEKSNLDKMQKQMNNMNQQFNQQVVGG